MCAYVRMCTHTFTVTLPVFSVAAFYLGHCYNLHRVEKEEEVEEQLPQPGGGEGNAVGVGKEEPLPQPGEGDADADSYWNRSRIQSAEAVPIRVVRRHPTHYDSQVRGVCVCSILWLSNAIYVIQGAAAAESSEQRQMQRCLACKSAILALAAACHSPIHSGPTRACSELCLICYSSCNCSGPSSFPAFPPSLPSSSTPWTIQLLCD